MRMPNHARPKSLFILMLSLSLFLVLPGCGRAYPNTDASSPGTDSGKGSDTVETDKPDGILPTPDPGESGSGLTPQEAIDLVWPEAKEGFGDAVLWRMVPVEEKDAAEMRLPDDWKETGKSGAWFIWYADPEGENWFMYSVLDNRVEGVDIGTRSFSKMTMPAEWPREKMPVSLKQALDAAVSQGADTKGIHWLEYTVDAGARGFNQTPYWIFSISSDMASGVTLEYRMFVNALTGQVDGAVNSRGDEMTLPIDPEELSKPRETDHQVDLEQFLAVLGGEDKIWAVRQLSSRMSPDEATGQMWLDAFESLQTVEVKSIAPVRLEEWTEGWEAYQVVLHVKTDAPPDSFGWENGENIRWIVIIPQGAGGWKVDEFSANP